MTIMLLNENKSIYEAFIEIDSIGEGPTYFISEKDYYYFNTNNLYIGSYRHEDIVNTLNKENDNQM